MIEKQAHRRLDELFLLPFIQRGLFANQRGPECERLQQPQKLLRRQLRIRNLQRSLFMSLFQPGDQAGFKLSRINHHLAGQVRRLQEPGKRNPCQILEFGRGHQVHRSLANVESQRTITLVSKKVATRSDYNCAMAELQTGLEGYVYMTDPNADAETRTFTVTLLVRNRKSQLKIPRGYQSENIARTKDIWSLNFTPILGGGNTLMTEEKAIRRDANGAFLWKITNRRAGEITSSANRVLNVEKVRITPGTIRVPFLGNWYFVPV